MSVTEITYTVTLTSLMRKPKGELASRVLRQIDELEAQDKTIAALRADLAEARDPDMFWDDECPDSESYRDDDEDLLREIFDNMGDDQAEITLRCAKSLPNRTYRCWWDGDDFRYEQVAEADGGEVKGLER